MDGPDPPLAPNTSDRYGQFYHTIAYTHRENERRSKRLLGEERTDGRMETELRNRAQFRSFLLLLYNSLYAACRKANCVSTPSNTSKLRTCLSVIQVQQSVCAGPSRWSDCGGASGLTEIRTIEIVVPDIKREKVHNASHFTEVVQNAHQSTEYTHHN